MASTHRVLAISGSLRAGSTASAVLRTAADVAPAGIAVTVFADLGTLPHFNPDDDHEPLPVPVRELRRAIAGAGSVLLATPEYAGALPGSFKNLLDWTVGGIELAGRPVAWINTSTSPTGGVAAHEDLRRVLTFVQADLVEEACLDLPVPRAAVDPDGVIRHEAVREQIAGVLRALARHRRPART